MDMDYKITYNKFDINYHIKKRNYFRIYDGCLIIEEHYNDRYFYPIVKDNNEQMTVEIESDFIFGIVSVQGEIKFGIPYDEDYWIIIDIDTLDCNTMDRKSFKVVERWFYEDFDRW